jgi:hypothetical protein
MLCSKLQLYDRRWKEPNEADKVQLEILVGAGFGGDSAKPSGSAGRHCNTAQVRFPRIITGPSNLEVRRHMIKQFIQPFEA